MSLIAEHGALIVSMMGGGQVVTMLGLVLVHLRSKRKQTDDWAGKQVAMSMERERALHDRVASLEAARDLDRAARDLDRVQADAREDQCQHELERVRHRQRNSEAMFESMFATVSMVTPERVGEVLQRFGDDWKARRERWANEDASGERDLRNAAQVVSSAASLVTDALKQGAAQAA